MTKFLLALICVVSCCPLNAAKACSPLTLDEGYKCFFQKMKDIYGENEEHVAQAKEIFNALTSALTDGEKVNNNKMNNKSSVLKMIFWLKNYAQTLNKEELHTALLKFLEEVKTQVGQSGKGLYDDFNALLGQKFDTKLADLLLPRRQDIGLFWNSAIFELFSNIVAGFSSIKDDSSFKNNDLENAYNRIKSFIEENKDQIFEATKSALERNWNLLVEKLPLYKNSEKNAKIVIDALNFYACYAGRSDHLAERIFEIEKNIQPVSQLLSWVDVTETMPTSKIILFLNEFIKSKPKETYCDNFYEEFWNGYNDSLKDTQMATNTKEKIEKINTYVQAKLKGLDTTNAIYKDGSDLFLTIKGVLIKYQEDMGIYESVCK